MDFNPTALKLHLILCLQLHPEAVISSQTFIPVYAHPIFYHQPIENHNYPRLWCTPFRAGKAHTCFDRYTSSRLFMCLSWHDPIMASALNVSNRAIQGLKTSRKESYAIKPQSNIVEQSQSFYPVTYHQFPVLNLSRKYTVKTFFFFNNPLSLRRILLLSNS